MFFRPENQAGDNLTSNHKKQRKQRKQDDTKNRSQLNKKGLSL